MAGWLQLKDSWLIWLSRHKPPKTNARPMPFYQLKNCRLQHIKHAASRLAMASHVCRVQRRLATMAKSA